MDRQALDSLYRASPSGAFRKALANLGADTFSFLREHADELDADMLLTLLGSPLADETDGLVEPFVRRLAEVIVTRFAQADAGNVRQAQGLPVAGIGLAVQALDLSRVLDPDAWADLTVRLQGHLPNPLWYGFVDQVRGGRVFNALNEAPPKLDPRDFLSPIAQNRHEPFVVRLLGERTNDPKAAAYVLSLPTNVVLRVHERVPDLVRLEDVRSVVACRVTAKDERWVPPLREWMTPHVVERLRHCPNEEALDLYRWLASKPGASSEGDLFDLALERFKVVLRTRDLASPASRAWPSLIGSRLTTGSAWKKRGRAVIEALVDCKLGFPPDLITAALGGATSKDGASVEDHGVAILRSMHDVAAKVFVERADDALKRGDLEWGRRLLRALTSLDPGSFIAPPVHHLRKIPNLPDDVVRLIEAGEQLAHSGGRAPSKDAFDEAFLVLAGSLS